MTILNELQGAGELEYLFSPLDNTRDFIIVVLAMIVFFIIVLRLLNHLPPVAKKWLTIICTFLAGLFFIFEYFWPTSELPDGSRGNWVTPMQEPVSNFVINVTIWMIFLGVISLCYVHGKRLFSRLPGWHNSLAFFLAFIGMTVVGLVSELGKADNGITGTMSVIYDSLYTGLLVNLDSAMFALLAFYIASASYRAFRVRTVEAALLMISALVIMLGLVSFGIAATSFIPVDSHFAIFRLEQLSTWLMQYINMPAQRAVTIGVMVGSLAMAMRLWLSLERGAFFSQEG